MASGKLYQFMAHKNITASLSHLAYSSKMYVKISETLNEHRCRFALFCMRESISD